MIWAPSSEFVSSRIPSWQILTAHAQPFRGARDLAFCLKVPLDSLLVWASSEGSGETARMRRLAWTFAARIGDKYQIRLTRSIWPICGIRHNVKTQFALYLVSKHILFTHSLFNKKKHENTSNGSLDLSKWIVWEPWQLKEVLWQHTENYALTVLSCNCLKICLITQVW